MLQRREILLLMVGILAGAVAGAVAGYGIHGTPAQGDMSGLAGAANVTSLGNGYYTVDGKQVDLQTLMFTVMSERANLLEEQVRDQAAKIQANNALLQSYNQQLHNLSVQRSALDPVKDKSQYDNLTQQMDDIRAQIDSLTSTSQLDMTALQATVNKYDQTFQVLSDFIAKNSQQMNQIVNNMR